MATRTFYVPTWPLDCPAFTHWSTSRIIGDDSFINGYYWSSQYSKKYEPDRTFGGEVWWQRTLRVRGNKITSRDAEVERMTGIIDRGDRPSEVKCYRTHLVQYWADEDEEAANILKEALDADIIKSDDRYSVSSHPFVFLVGAQEVNPVFKWYNDYIFEPVTVALDGKIIIQKVGAGEQTMHSIGGWETSETLAAANYIKEHGVPASTLIIDVPAPPEVTLESLRAEATERKTEALANIATYGFPEVFSHISWMNTFKDKVIAAGFAIFEDWSIGTPPEPPPPDEEVSWFTNLLNTSFDLALTAFFPLSNTIKNVILAGILTTDTGKNLLENFARWLGDKFLDKYPEYEPLRGEPEGSLTVLAILGLIGGILGFGTLINWARKELPEPSGMAVWASIEAQDWVLANNANQQYIKFIHATNGFVGTALSWFNPFIKTWFDINRDSQLATAANYQTIIDANLVVKSTLNISSIPTGAKIYVDGAYTFELTNTSVTVEAGHHTITLKKVDYTDAFQEFDIAAGETKYISMTLTSGVEPPVPPTPEPPDIPSEEVVIPLVPSEVVYNAWKVTIKAVDAATNEPLGAAILINDEFMDKYTPWWFYFAPESTYNIKIRKKGYKQGEVTYTTPALPTT